MNQQLTPYNNSRDMMLLDQKEHITKEEHEKILQACVEIYNNTKLPTETNQYIMERNYFLLLCLWNTGARISDVCQFKVSDFDTYRGHITFTVNKTSKKDDNGDIILLKKHTVILEPTFFNQFHNYINKWNIKGYMFSKFKHRSDEINGDNHIKRRQVNKFIAKYGKFAGLEKNIHPHLYRHGIAIEMLKNNVALEIISKFLGHANVQTTIQFYAKITPEICWKHIQEKMRIN